MKTKSLALSVLFMLIALSFGQAQKPGFYVQGRFLYDRCGEKTILRGVNEMSVWAGADPIGAMYMPEIRKTGANCVRIVWKMSGTQGQEANLDQLIQNCINNKMIPMVELHDATGPYWNMLPQLVDYWIRPDILKIIKKHEQYLLVNIANEIGDENVTQTQFISGYQDAIKRMRAAGIRTPLVIDAQDWGKNMDMLTQTASTILNSDPDKNIVFSAHLYWPKKFGADDAFITNAIQKAVDAGYCLIIGEFSKYGAWAGQDAQGKPISVCSPDGEINYQTILRECQKHGIGWLYWSWGAASNTGGGDPKCANMDMTVGGLYSKLQAGFATEIALSSPYSIKNTSVTPKSILNGSCGTTPPPTKQLTSCANSFLTSLGYLVSGVGTKTCGVGTNANTDVFGQMKDGCYGATTNSTARVAYTMFKFNQTAAIPQYRPIRVIWSSKKSVYDYYGVCTPPNLVYELPETTENHVFEAVLVPITAYQGSTNPVARSYDQWKTQFALPINTVQKVQNFTLEPSTGYIATKEKANYDNVYSSKGIVVRVLSQGRTIDCYLINNYDGAGTVTWKK